MHKDGICLYFVRFPINENLINHQNLYSFAQKRLFLNIFNLIRHILRKDNTFLIKLNQFRVSIWSKTCIFWSKWSSLRPIFSKNRKLPQKSSIFSIKIPSEFLKKCFPFKSYGVWAEIFPILRRRLLFGLTSKTNKNTHMYELQTALLRSKE